MTDNKLDVEELERIAREAMRPPIYDNHGGYGRCRGTGQVWVGIPRSEANFYSLGACEDCATPSANVSIYAPDLLRLLSERKQMVEALEEIARDGRGLQGLEEDGADNQVRAAYWRAQATYRRDKARAALALSVQEGRQEDSSSREAEHLVASLPRSDTQSSTGKEDL